jgi:hypothetical protein
MDLLIRPSLFNMTPSLAQIDELLSGSGLSFALFHSRDRLLLANTLFIKRWNLHRISFPQYSLADFGNSNALLLTGATKGKFWHWFSEKDSNLSLIVLPQRKGETTTTLLRVPTEKGTAENPIFLEIISHPLSEEEKDGLLLLGRRLRVPARTIVRAFSDEVILDKFIREDLDKDPFRHTAEVILVKEASWRPESSFWRIQQPVPPGNKKVASDLPQTEGSTLFPFRRISYSVSPGQGFWADFPLLFDNSFFGKIRLFRPEARKKELPALRRFQVPAQTLSRLLFDVRVGLGYLEPFERAPETGFLSRKGTLRLLESLIEEYRKSQSGFGLVGLKVDLVNHREFMIKVGGVLRFYDEVGHLTTREYLLILPSMNPGSFDVIIKRIQDLLLGMKQDQEHLLSFGTISFPESHKGPMNLIRSAFLREAGQSVQKSTP